MLISTNKNDCNFETQVKMVMTPSHAKTKRRSSKSCVSIKNGPTKKMLTLTLTLNAYGNIVWFLKINLPLKSSTMLSIKMNIDIILRKRVPWEELSLGDVFSRAFIIPNNKTKWRLILHLLPGPLFRAPCDDRIKCFDRWQPPWYFQIEFRRHKQRFQSPYLRRMKKKQVRITCFWLWASERLSGPSINAAQEDESRKLWKIALWIKLQDDYQGNKVSGVQA